MQFKCKLQNSDHLKLIFDSLLDFYRGHIACRPPSTGSETPVEKLAKSLAKNVIAFASSSTVP